MYRGTHEKMISPDDLAVELQPCGRKNLDGYSIQIFFYRRAVVLQLRTINMYSGTLGKMISRTMYTEH
jgi:hypothetical protein